MSLPGPPDARLDGSWQEMLIHAHYQGLQFGRDIIFTWGPWGFLCTRYHPWSGRWRPFPIIPDLADRRASLLLAFGAGRASPRGLAMWRRHPVLRRSSHDPVALPGHRLLLWSWRWSAVRGPHGPRCALAAPGRMDAPPWVSCPAQVHLFCGLRRGRPCWRRVLVATPQGKQAGGQDPGRILRSRSWAQEACRTKASATCTPMSCGAWRSLRDTATPWASTSRPRPCSAGVPLVTLPLPFAFCWDTWRSAPDRMLWGGRPRRFLALTFFVMWKESFTRADLVALGRAYRRPSSASSSYLGRSASDSCFPAGDGIGSTPPTWFALSASDASVDPDFYSQDAQRRVAAHIRGLPEASGRLVSLLR